jgi:integrase/recombinase XerD
MKAGLDQYLNYLRAIDYTAGTIRWQQSHLESFQSYLNQKGIVDFTSVTNETIRAYLATLNRRRLSASTRQAHLSAIKGLFSYLLRQGLITADPAGRLEAPKKTYVLPEVPTEAEILQILAVPDLHTPIGIRDRAILELLYSSGLRRCELTNLNLADIDLNQGYVRVNQGKNRKDRIVPLGATAAKFIEAYLKLVRWWYIRDSTENALFLDCAKGRRISPSTMGYIVRKIVKKTGIKKKVSPHSFRHAMATHLLHNQADIRHIQLMLGHASLATTQLYTHLNISDLNEVLRRSHPHGCRGAELDS